GLDVRPARPVDGVSQIFGLGVAAVHQARAPDVDPAFAARPVRAEVEGAVVGGGGEVFAPFAVRRSVEMPGLAPAGGGALGALNVPDVEVLHRLAVARSETKKIRRPSAESTGSESRQVPENGATSGGLQRPSTRCETWIV